MDKKQCRVCLIVKSIDNFYVKRKGKRGQNLYASRCKECHGKIHREKYYSESPDQKKRRQELAKKSHLSRKFGLTINEFSAMILEQNNKCKICECEMKQPQVDHNHSTGKVRSLLCKPCNMSLGLLKEDTKVLYNMISYINASIS
jgi:hypothetical protein